MATAGMTRPGYCFGLLGTEQTERFHVRAAATTVTASTSACSLPCHRGPSGSWRSGVPAVASDTSSSRRTRAGMPPGSSRSRRRRERLDDVFVFGVQIETPPTKRSLDRLLLGDVLDHLLDVEPAAPLLVHCRVHPDAALEPLDTYQSVVSGSKLPDPLAGFALSRSPVSPASTTMTSSSRICFDHPALTRARRTRSSTCATRPPLPRVQQGAGNGPTRPCGVHAAGHLPATW
jgi:hypothetical protein